MEVHRRRATTWYLFFIYLDIGLTSVRNMVLVPLYLTNIEPRLYGAWLASGDVIASMAILDLGIGRVLLQKIAEAYGSKDTKGLLELMGTGIWAYLAISMIPFLLGLASASFVTSFVQMDGQAGEELRIAFIIASGAMSLTVFYSGVGAVLSGLQRQVGINAIRLVGMFCGIGTTVLLLLMGFRLLSIALGTLVEALISFGGGLVLLSRTTKYHFASERITFRLPVFTDLLKYSLILFVSSLAFALVARSPNVFIAHVFDPYLCNQYVFTFMAHSLIVTIVVSLSHAIVPGLSHLKGESDEAKTKAVVNKLIKVSALGAAWLIGGALLLNEEFVRLWVGSEYYGGFLLNVIFCASGFFAVAFMVFNNVFVARGIFDLNAKSNFLKAGFHLCLLITFGMFWGLKGVALAMAISFGLVVCAIQTPVLFELLGVRWPTAARDLLVPVTIVGIPICVSLLLQAFVAPTGLLSFVIFGFIYSTVTGYCYYALVPDIRKFAQATVREWRLQYFGI